MCIKFYITTNCMLVLQNKCTYVVTLFTYRITDMVPQRYFKISPNSTIHFEHVDGPVKIQILCPSNLELLSRH